MLRTLFATAVAIASLSAAVDMSPILASGGSRLDPHDLEFIHVADDYRVDGASGCASCGGGAGTGEDIGRLPTLHLQRIHRYQSYDRHSSFGQGVFLNYDLTLACAFENGQPIVEYFDPVQFGLVTLTDPTSSGVFVDADRALVNGLRYYDSSHAQVANHLQATTAELRMHNGEVAVFELMRTNLNPASQERDGRLIQYRDRNGNALSISYVYAANATDPILTYERQRLWCMDSITDAYGQTAHITNAQWGYLVNFWYISRVDLPNGQHLDYALGGGGFASLYTVGHPDGSQTHVDTATPLENDLPQYAQLASIVIEDAAASGLYRRVVVLYTRAAWIDPATGLYTEQPQLRLRRIQSVTGEVLYGNSSSLNATDGSVQVSHYVGNLVIRQTADASGRPLADDAMIPGSAVRQATYQYDLHQNPTSISDGLGHTTTRVYDPLTNALTQTTFPDGTSESTTYNQFNEPLVYTDRLGLQTKYDYDDNGNLIAKTAALGTAEAATWRWTYGESGSNARPGQPSSSTDANGNITRYVYDARGYLQDIIEPKDFTTDTISPTRHLHHDAAGRLDQSRDEAGRTASYAYDPCNRLILTTYADGSSEAIGYGTWALSSTSGLNTANLKIWSRDRNGNHTVYQYDASSRLVKTIAGLTLLAGHTSSDSLADYANVSSASVTSTQYLPGTELPTAITTNGERVDIAYDSFRREMSRTRTNDSGTTIVDQTTYDAANRVDSRATKIATQTWTTFFVYDSMDRVVRSIRETSPNGAFSYSQATDRPTAPRITTPNPAYLIDDQQYDLAPAAAGYTPSSVIASSVFKVRVATDPRGIKHLRAYDHQSRLVEEVDALGTADESRMAHQYDAQGNCVRTYLPRHFTEPGGFTTAYAYSGRNLVTMVREAEGRAEEATTLTTYSPTGKPAVVTVAAGTADAATTIYTYGVCCDRVVQVQDGEGYQTTYGYDPVGNVTSMTDPLLHTTLMTYDARNRVIMRLDGAGDRTSYVYDDNLLDGIGLDQKYPSLTSSLSLSTGNRDGSAVEITDANGKASLEAFDAQGRVVRRIDANGKATTIAYEYLGAPAGYPSTAVDTRTTDPLFNVTDAYVDGQHRSIGMMDAESRSTLFQVDGNGNRVRVVDRDSHATTYAFDNRDRQVSCTDAVNITTHSAYDAAGDVTFVQDGLQKTTLFTYDGRGRKVATQDRIRGITQFTYDCRNNIVGLMDAEGKATIYAYDRRNLLKSEAFPPPTGGTRTYDYDAAGRLSHRVDQTSTSTGYEYDAADRLLFRHYADGKDDSFGYDLVGRLTHAASTRYANSVDRQYDPAGRLLNETQTIAGTAYVVGYTYDDANRKTHVAYPGGDSIDRTYTARNQLQQLKFDGTEVAFRQYDPEMLLTSTRYLGGVTTETRSYFADNQLHTMTAPGITSLTYAYNADKSVQSETDGILAAQSQTYGYDDEQRLTTWSRTSGDSQSWTLTPVGDWQATTVDGVSDARTHSNVHELTAITRGATTTPLAYDAKGNLTLNQDGAAYGWDIENRLATAAISDAIEGVGDVATYEYDALGRRVRKTAWGVTTTFLYDGAQVIREFDAPQQLPPSAAGDDGSGSGAPPGAGILPNALVRVNFQPALRAIPAGFVADKGKMDAVRSNGYTYGWDIDRTADAISRGVHPLPQYDTFVRMASNAAAPGTWTIALPNGTYPIVVVMGDAISRHQTNNVIIQGIAETDPDPYDPNETQAYLLGDFDGYAELVTVTDGTLTIQVGSGAIDPKLCFIEIGHNGDPLDQATKDKLTAQVGAATQRTGGAAFPKPQPTPREYAYGTYVDEPLMFSAASVKYGVLADRRYSVQGLVSSSANLIERYSYDAYGQRTVLSTTAVVIGADSAVGFNFGYTGRLHDRDTRLIDCRSRTYSPVLGRFLSRDIAEYVDGLSMYEAYFAPQSVDPSGRWGPGGHFWTTCAIARAAGMGAEDAFALAYYSQFPDEHWSTDAITGLLGLDAWELNHSIQDYLHSLHGGDVNARRNALRCLLNNPSLAPWERGMIIHAFGDSYAHTYRPLNWHYGPPESAGVPWGGKGRGPIIIDGLGDEQSFGWPLGHLFAGHQPDIIPAHIGVYSGYADGSYPGHDTGYVQDLYGVLSGGNDLNPAMINLVNASRTWQTEQDAINYLSQACGYDPATHDGWLPGGKGNPFPPHQWGDVMSVVNKIKKATECPCGGN